MRWIKHPSGMGRHPAISELRSVLGLAGYAAFWLLLERIAETWNGSDEPELCLPEREWRVSCGFSAKKFQIFAEILQKHAIIRMEKCDSLLRLKVPILLQLQDEWTRKTRKNSGVDPERLRSHSGIQTEAYPEKEKDNKTHAPPPLRPVLFPVLKRHGVRADSERGRNILHYVEQKRPVNPGGYLESIFQKNRISIRYRMKLLQNMAAGRLTDNKSRVWLEIFYGTWSYSRRRRRMADLKKAGTRMLPLSVRPLSVRPSRPQQCRERRFCQGQALASRSAALDIHRLAPDRKSMRAMDVNMLRRGSEHEYAQAGKAKNQKTFRRFVSSFADVLHDFFSVFPR